MFFPITSWGKMSTTTELLWSPAGRTVFTNVRSPGPPTCLTKRDKDDEAVEQRERGDRACPRRGLPGVGGRTPSRHRPPTRPRAPLPAPACQPHGGGERVRLGHSAGAWAPWEEGDCTQGRLAPRHTRGGFCEPHDRPPRPNARRLGSNRGPRRPPLPQCRPTRGDRHAGSGGRASPKVTRLCGPHTLLGPGVPAPGQCPHLCKRRPERPLDRGTLSGRTHPRH